jgi:EAL domain-containing protein (putative c-di-GMP-specific phosphodiesterase class I)
VTSEGDDDERHGLPASRLASTLGVPVIAEGIERPGQLDRLLELGGTLGQGFLLGRPAEFGDLELSRRPAERPRAALRA